MTTEEIERLLARPTVTVDQAAGILDASRNGTYESVRRGDLPSTRLGKRIFVLTGPLRRKLGLEPAARG
jgi:hypothetical protein